MGTVKVFKSRFAACDRCSGEESAQEQTDAYGNAERYTDGKITLCKKHSHLIWNPREIPQ